MELIKIDGEDFRVLDYSTPDRRMVFYRPVSVGAGYRRMIEKQTVTNAFQSGGFSKILSTEVRKHRPNGLSDSDWLDQCKRNATAALVESFDLNDSPDKDLATLEVLLTPAPNSMDVKRWYMHFSTEEQVNENLNFLSGNVPVKIETEVTLPSTGKATNRARKAAA